MTIGTDLLIHQTGRMFRTSLTRLGSEKPIVALAHMWYVKRKGWSISCKLVVLRVFNFNFAKIFLYRFCTADPAKGPFWHFWHFEESITYVESIG